MELNLKGKKVVVLGGSRGIGRGVAETFAQEGADIAICARDARQVGEAVESLKSKGVAAIGGAFDISDARRNARLDRRSRWGPGGR